MAAPLKRVLNFHEEVTHLKLREVCEQNGATVFTKLRAADVLPIEGSGVSDDDYRFALQSHFDFVVANELHDPLFAVEFDGPSHLDERQRRRDERKNRLCDVFGLPLLRVSSKHVLKTFRDLDLLSWFVGVWFLKRAFDGALEAGDIPEDLFFDPQSVAGVVSGDAKWTFPFWLSLPIRSEIAMEFASGRIVDQAPSVMVGRDIHTNYRALAWLRVTPEAGTYVQTGMRAQRFAIPLAGLAEDLALFDLQQELYGVLTNAQEPVPVMEIKSAARDFRQRWGSVSASFNGGMGAWVDDVSSSLRRPSAPRNP